MEILSTDPLILTIDNFLTDNECDHIIKISNNNLSKAKTCYYNDEDKKRLNDENFKGRTNTHHWIKYKKDKIVDNLFNKASKLLQTRNELFEALQVVHYNEKELFDYHYDAWNKNKKEQYDKYCSERGNRIYTLLIYLNDVKKGGHTGFNLTKNEIQIKPKKGKALLFKNLNEDGSLNTKSKHSGLPVLEGEKWACNLWLREKPLKEKKSNKILKDLPELDLDYIDNISDED